MKIIYSADNNPGSIIQLERFLKVARKRHKIKIATNSRYHAHFKYIDWCLDAILPRDLEHVKRDIVRFSPQIIVVDNEEIFANMAHELNVVLWSCSCLHLLDGINWDFSSGPYKTLLKKKDIKADRYLIYSLFGDVSMRPILKDGFEWVSPYAEKPKTFNSYDYERLKTGGIKLFNDYFSNGYFCTGETSFVADAIYNGKSVYISPSSKNPESLLNALFVDYYRLGKNLGNIDNKKLALKYLNNLPPVSKFSLSIQNYPKLHELLCNI